MFEELKSAESSLVRLLKDTAYWKAVVRSLPNNAHILTAWRDLSPSHHLVLQILLGEHDFKLEECNPYIMRVVSGVCDFVQAIELENEKLEIVCGAQLAAGTIYNMRDTDCWHSLRPHKKETMLLRISKSQADNDYYSFDKYMDDEHLEWMLKKFLPIYEGKK